MVKQATHVRMSMLNHTSLDASIERSGVRRASTSVSSCQIKRRVSPAISGNYNIQHDGKTVGELYKAIGTIKTESSVGGSRRVRRMYMQARITRHGVA